MPTGETTTDADGNYRLAFGPAMVVKDKSGHVDVTKTIEQTVLQAAVIAPQKSGYYEQNLHRQGDLRMGRELPAPEQHRRFPPEKVILPNKPKRIDFVMLPAASINGRVLDEQGKPLASQRFYVDGEELAPAASVLREFRPDETGKFSMADVPCKSYWFTPADGGLNHLKSNALSFPRPGSYQLELILNRTKKELRARIVSSLRSSETWGRGKGLIADAVAPEGQANEDGPANAQTRDLHRGSVSGIVVDAATGQPIAGAYVAIDHSGDAGGANIERFRAQGIYVTTETDAQGRFNLEGVALPAAHPFMVTHPGYVRHQKVVVLRKDESRIRVQVALQKGSTIKVSAVDAARDPLEGATWFRLEAKAGAIFTPMRDDWPVTSTRMEEVKDGRCAFGELPAGAYSIDVLQIRARGRERAHEMLGKSLKEIREIASSLTAEVLYHAGPEQIVLGAGETKELRMPPGSHRSEVTVRISEDPSLDPEQTLRRPEQYSDYEGMGFGHILVVSRRPGHLLWMSNRFMHLEDHRLGRIYLNSLLYRILVSGQQCRLKNFPPGDYALFAGTFAPNPNVGYPAFFRGAKVEIREGLEKTVTIPWREPEGQSDAASSALRALNTTVPMGSRSYTVPELCDLLTSKTGSGAEFIAAPTLRERSVTLSQSNVSIWELLERLHLEQQCNLEVQGHRFTLTEMK